VVLSCSFLFLFAQLPHLKIQGIGPNLYLTHKVEPKETVYNLSRVYNITPQSIFILNGLRQNAGLSIDQEIRIPLLPTNFVQNGQMADDETLVPLFHTVAAGENLYRVSINFNKVKPDALKEWNNLSKDVVQVGQDIIVGYLRIKKDKLAYIKGDATAVEVTETAKKPDPKPTYTDPKPVVTNTSNNAGEGYFAKAFHC